MAEWSYHVTDVLHEITGERKAPNGEVLSTFPVDLTREGQIHIHGYYSSPVGTQYVHNFGVDVWSTEAEIRGLVRATWVKRFGESERIREKLHPRVGKDPVGAERITGQTEFRKLLNEVNKNPGHPNTDRVRSSMAAFAASHDALKGQDISIIPAVDENVYRVDPRIKLDDSPREVTRS